MPARRPRAPLPIASLASFLSLVSLAACASGPRPPAVPPVLTIQAPATTPMPGVSLPLHAAGAPRGARVRWVATPSDRAWISPDGTLTLLEPGDVHVHATDGWREGTLGFAVRMNPAARVVMQQLVVPHAQVGETVRVTGHVYDATGTRVPDAPVAYAVVLRGEDPADATVTADGRFVASRPGIYTVIAECGRVSARTVVIVESEEDRFARMLAAQPPVTPAAPAPADAGAPLRHQDTVVAEPVRHHDAAALSDSTRLARTLGQVTVAAVRTVRVVIDPADEAPYDGTTLSLGARVWVSGQEVPDSTAQVLWMSSDPSRAWVSQRGRVVFLAPGWVTLTASHGGVSVTRRFNVRAHMVTRLALRPSTPDAIVGRPVRFREDVWEPGAIPLTDARVNYAIIAHGVEGAVPATLTEDRVFRAWRPGVYTVIAEVGGVADKFTLLVREADVAAK